MIVKVTWWAVENDLLYHKIHIKHHKYFNNIKDAITFIFLLSKEENVESIEMVQGK